MLRLYHRYFEPSQLISPTTAFLRRVNLGGVTVRGYRATPELVRGNHGPTAAVAPRKISTSIFESTAGSRAGYITGAGLIRKNYRISEFASRPALTTIVKGVRNMATKADEFSVASKVVLGNGIAMPKIHFGVYEVDAGKECEKVVTWALEAGYRAIDSAQWYYNEASCGKAITSFLSSHPETTRQDIFFTTKLQNNVSYNDTRQNIKASIQKTGLGYIDLYLLHSPYGGKAKRAECWRAVADAVDAGEVRVGGVSNFGVRHLRELLGQLGNDEPANRRPQVNQIEVHPFNTNSEITSFCQTHNIQIQAYAPLVRAKRFNHPVIKELSSKYNCSPAQLLVRWSLQMGYVPLPKSVNKQRIEANKNIEGILISEEDVKRLEGLDERLVTDWDPTNAP